MPYEHARRKRVKQLFSPQDFLVMPLYKFSLDWLNSDLHLDWVPWLAASKSVDTKLWSVQHLQKRIFTLIWVFKLSRATVKVKKKHLAMLDCLISSAPINTLFTRQSNINCAVASNSSSASDSLAFQFIRSSIHKHFLRLITGKATISAKQHS